MQAAGSFAEPVGTAVAADRRPLAIEARGLVRRFGEITALDGVSLKIGDGEFFSLLGPSGCGKTTLLRIVAGLETPDAGTLRIAGSDALRIPAHRRPVNTVFQSYALFPHLTVWENIAFGLRMRKVPRPEMQRRVERVMEAVALEGLAARKPAELSGGQKQRVALARALVNEPRVLLLDEPLGALDLKLRRQLQQELRTLQRRLGITFLHVTHDQDEALALSDRMAVMNAGRIEQIGTGRQLYERPRNRFVAQFLGGCNLVEGTVVAVGGASGNSLEVDTPFGRLMVQAPGERRSQLGQQVTLAIRPERVGMCRAEAGSGTGKFVRAVVADLTFTGAETLFRLEVGGHMLRATAFNAAGPPPVHLGDEVAVCAAPESWIVLED